MSRNTERRAVTLFLLILLAIATLRASESQPASLALAPVSVLVMRVVSFYFPRRGSGAQR